MRIGIDISQTAVPGSGVARFTSGLVATICERDTSHEWHFIYSSLRQPPPKHIVRLIAQRNFALHRLPIPPTLLATLWNNLHILDVQKVTGPLDWYISSDWTEPPATCRKATVIHDLAFMRFPETVDQKILATQNQRIRHVVSETDILFADSESTKKDIQSLLHVEAHKIIVNYPGLSHDTHPSKEPLDPRITRPYILSVGKREPRKNLEGLISAYQAITPEGIDLVIAGDRGWGDTADIKSTSQNIHFLGYVPDTQLSTLYEHCLCFVYPSIWEGFGYPVVEAMMHGAPVATSHTSSLGEVAQDAALLFNPHSTEEIARAITTLIGDKALRKKLSEKGKKRATYFTWKRYYETLMKALI